MLWVRRFFGQFFSLLFLIGLLLTALTFSLYQTFNKPDNLQTWLSESRLYDHFTDGIAKQSFDAVSKQSSAVDNSVVFQEAAKQAFTPELIEQSVNIFIASNYDWLQGNSPAPNFSIDLTSAKATFARQVALATQQRLLSLPPCTAGQAAQYTPDTDPLSLTCLPPGVNPAQLTERFQQELLNSTQFLSNPVLTADNINPDGGEPYYKAFPDAPRYYQLSKYAYLALAGITAVFGIIVFFLCPTRRQGVRRLGLLLGEAGIILVAGKFIASYVLEQLSTKVFNNTNTGELQKALTDFLGRVEGAVLGTALWFGVGYIVISAVLLLGLLVRRKHAPYHHKTILDDEPSADMPLLDEAPASENNVEPRQQTAPKPPAMIDIAPPPKARPSGPPPLSPEVKPRKKPRLIQ